MNIVRCPRGHISLPESWQAAGNQCAYPGCGYRGNPDFTGAFQTTPTAINVVSQTSTTMPIAASTSINVLSQTSTAIPSPASPLDIRVHREQEIRLINTRRLWWPTFWFSVASAIVTMASFAAVAATGWYILLANGGVPSELLRTYIPIGGTFAVLAGITVLVAGLVLTLLRCYWPRQ